MSMYINENPTLAIEPVENGWIIYTKGKTTRVYTDIDELVGGVKELLLEKPKPQDTKEKV